MIAERQRVFFDYLNKQRDTKVMQVSPRDWGPHHRADGFPVFKPGNADDMYRYGYAEEVVLPAIVKFAPDLIYVQEEYASYAARQAAGWAAALKVPLCVFVWENLRKPPPLPVQPDLVIAGNSEAYELHDADKIMPQVGIDETLFKYHGSDRDWDVLFASGKRTDAKGYPLFAKLPHRKLESTGKIPYASLAARLYWPSKVVVTPSRDTPEWKEQFAPMVNCEGLMCGCYVVASDTAAMKEWLKDVPGVSFFPQGIYEDLEWTVDNAVSCYHETGPNNAGSFKATEEFSARVVAGRLLEAFAQI